MSLAAVTLRSDDLTVVCHPDHGFVISEIVDTASGENILWNPPHASFEPLTGNLGPGGDRSIESFDAHIFAGGWFCMFPTAGLPGGHADRRMHGDAPRLPWAVVTSSEAVVEATVRLPQGFRVDRTISVTGSVVEARTRIANTGISSQTYSFGEHPCFPRSLVAGGALLLPEGTEGTIGSPAQLDASLYADHQEFAWPLARLKSGGLDDLSVIPTVADGRHDHLGLTHPGERVELESPVLNRRIVIRRDASQLPFLLVWEHFLPEGSIWPGDVIAVEPATSAGRTFDDAISTETTRVLRAGESIEFWMSVALSEPTSGTRRNHQLDHTRA